MEEKDFKEMIALLKRMNYLSRKYDKLFDVGFDEEQPVHIPEDIYDEICFIMKTKEILFLGIS